MMDLVYNSLIDVGLAMLFLAAVMSTHILFKSYYSIKVQGMSWNTSVFLTGVLKVIVVSIGTALLTLVFVLFPIYLKYVGINIPEDMMGFLNVSTILVIFISPTVTYCKKNIETLQNIINDFDESKYKMVEVDSSDTTNNDNSDIKKLNG